MTDREKAKTDRSPTELYESIEKHLCSLQKYLAEAQDEAESAERLLNDFANETKGMMNGEPLDS